MHRHSHRNTHRINHRRSRRHSAKIVIIYTLTTLVSFSITMFIMSLLTYFMYQTGALERVHQVLFLIVFSLVCIIFGTVLAKKTGRRMINSIIEIDNATKEIASGNYEIRLDEEKHLAEEMKSMVHNFNRMVDELNATEMLRNDFIENVSHEFKTPLSAIEGYTILLSNPDLSAEDKEQYIKSILSSTKRLSSLASNILLISKLDHQEIPKKFTSFSLDEQMRESLLPFESKWIEKNVELNIDLDSITYHGNKELLAQVWQNLIENALKFVKPNGTIRIILRQSKDITRIDIVDNGIGMSSEVKSRIYEKFYQGDSSRSVSGNGLGLTLVKRIIDLHQGTIKVSSIEGKGTTFTILLPNIT